MTDKTLDELAEELADKLGLGYLPNSRDCYPEDIAAIKQALQTMSELPQIQRSSGCVYCDLEIGDSGLVEALEGLLDNYRTEGCPDPNCGICIKSRATEEAAKAALEAAKRKAYEECAGVCLQHEECYQAIMEMKDE